MQREPVVAGTFYDSDPSSLKRTIENLLSGLQKGPEYDAVICPHAGYTYSGRSAARALSSLRESKRFIIIGPNHSGLGSQFSTMKGYWKTPLGNISIDNEMSKEILSHSLVKNDSRSHSREHSIEVILPFLQHLFGPKISFVPISILGSGYNSSILLDCKKLGSLIAGVSKKYNARIIASSDFSHYIPSEEAKKKDFAAIDAIKDIDPEEFFRVLHKIRASVCGYAPIATLLYAAPKLNLKKAELLEYTNSGEISGDESEVVSYASIGFR